MTSSKIEISIKKGESLQSIEDHYSLLFGEPTEIGIRLPKAIAYGGSFGILPALLQFVGSWARSEKAGEMRFYSSSTHADAIVSAVANPLGLVATYMAPAIAEDLGTRNQLLKPLETLLK